MQRSGAHLIAIDQSQRLPNGLFAVEAVDHTDCDIGAGDAAEDVVRVGQDTAPGAGAVAQTPRPQNRKRETARAQTFLSFVFFGKCSTDFFEQWWGDRNA